jgi:hypothetical protein
MRMARLLVDQFSGVRRRRTCLVSKQQTCWAPGRSPAWRRRGVTANLGLEGSRGECHGRALANASDGDAPNSLIGPITADSDYFAHIVDMGKLLN